MYVFMRLVPCYDILYDFA